MSEWQNPLFTKVIRKSKLGCIITMNRFNVGPKLCVNESTKGRKNTIDIKFCFQQVHPSKMRIIIHNC